MTHNSTTPGYDELSSFISHKFALLRAPSMEWTNLARLAIQKLPYDADRLTELENLIDALRAELRTAVIIASEYFDDLLLTRLRGEAHMSKSAWRSLKKNRPITIKTGFTLVSY